MVFLVGHFYIIIITLEAPRRFFQVNLLDKQSSEVEACAALLLL